MMLSLPVSCDDDSSSVPCDPSCGVVLRRGFASDVANYYEIFVKNECSGNVDGFQVSRGDYYKFDKGDEICTIDGSTWKRIPTKN